MEECITMSQARAGQKHQQDPSKSCGKLLKQSLMFQLQSLDPEEQSDDLNQDFRKFELADRDLHNPAALPHHCPFLR
jgi:hypothetical protein